MRWRRGARHLRVPFHLPGSRRRVVRSVRRRSGEPPQVGRQRLGVLVVLTMLVAVLLGGRLVQLQLVNGAANRRAAVGINTRVVTETAQRGRILAADGSVLVGNGSSTTLTVDPSALQTSPDGGRALLTRVARVVGRSPSSLLARTKTCGTKGAPPSPVCFDGQPFQPVPIASDVDEAKALTIVERPEAYPGIATTATATRTYDAQARTLAQIVGYLTPVTADDEKVAERSNHHLDPTSLLGRSGLEQQYDSVLHGTDGRRVVGIGPDGSARRNISDSAPVPGRDVRTSIQPAVQRAAAKALSDGIAKARKAKNKATSGSVVVLDAANGGVVAATNEPTYDPSVWTGGISQSEYDALLAPGAGDPLADRAASVAGPPASTFKAFSLLAAARTGVDPDGTYSCPSVFMVGNRAYHNFESAAYGSVSIPKGIGVSCDTMFYRWAYSNWIHSGGSKISATTPDPYADVARSFGFGRATGVDLPREATGEVPDPASKRRQWLATKQDSCRRARTGYPEVKDRSNAAYLKKVAQENCTSGYQWRAGDAVNFAIGQGDVAVTPLQLAVAYAAIANGGTIFAPRFATALASGDGSRTERVTAPRRGHVTFDHAMLAKELDGLHQVVTSGTASGAFAGFDLARYPLAGKTGTAEVYGKGSTAWFASFGPRTRSGHQYVVVVRVDEGGEGGKTAAPIARQVWDALSKER